MTRNQYKRKRRTQRLYGLILIAISIICIILACQGATVADRDCTAVLFLAPLGFYMVFSRKLVFV